MNTWAWIKFGLLCFGMSAVVGFLASYFVCRALSS